MKDAVCPAYRGHAYGNALAESVATQASAFWQLVLSCRNFAVWCDTNHVPLLQPKSHPVKIHRMSPSNSCCSVLVVEDDPAFRQRFTRLIVGAPDMHLLGEAADLASGLALLDGPRADVLLVDLGLPGGCGTNLIREMVRRWPACDVMVVTVFGDEAHIMTAIEAGATGYLLKDEDGSDLLQQIRSLRAGGSPITPVVARQLLARLTPAEMQPLRASSATEDCLLSPQEARVLNLSAKGYSYEEVAALLEISRHTVMTHVKRSYRKLQVSSKTEAIYEARRMGLVTD